MHLKSLREAKEFLREVWKRDEMVGSVHTLGALHQGHGKLIQLSAQENTHTIVTIYPNKIQLFPGLPYKYDLKRDVDFAIESGATTVISSCDSEMFSEDFRTFITQGDSHSRLNSSVFSFASKGQVTGTIRWLNFTRPHRSYFGLKDIEQALLVKRAVADLLIDCEIKHVPCIRFRNGVPISSRLRFLEEHILSEVSALYEVMNLGREKICQGETDSSQVLAKMREQLNQRLNHFHILYLTLVDISDFAEKEEASLPFILHGAIRYKDLTHFDGLLITNEKELQQGPSVIWLNQD